MTSPTPSHDPCQRHPSAALPLLPRLVSASSNESDQARPLQEELEVTHGFVFLELKKVIAIWRLTSLTCRTPGLDTALPNFINSTNRSNPRIILKNDLPQFDRSEKVLSILQITDIPWPNLTSPAIVPSNLVYSSFAHLSIHATTSFLSPSVGFLSG